MPAAVLPLDPIAIFSHDFVSQSPLRSWPPVPAETLHQGELLALKAFGSLLENIRSPRHLYFAAWRDPDPSWLPGQEDNPPTSILFMAQFGVAPYETSTSLLELADMYNRRDRAGLRFDLARDEDGDFRLEKLELEMNDPSSPTGRLFRSCWRGEEVRRLNLTLNVDPPASRRDPIRFHLHARLPGRYNHGAEIEPEQVEFTASGGAMPLPAWVNY